MVGKPWCQILVPSGSIVVAAICETGLLLHRGMVCEGRAQETGLTPVPPSSLKQAGLGPEHHSERKHLKWHELTWELGTSLLPGVNLAPGLEVFLPLGLFFTPSPHRSCSL